MIFFSNTQSIKILLIIFFIHGRLKIIISKLKNLNISDMWNRNNLMELRKINSKEEFYNNEILKNTSY